jgi:heme-degrading monooxygenase HmoA
VPHIPPPLPWKRFAEPDADREYLVLLTTLPVGRLSKLPRFLAYTRRIQKQLDARPPGLVGYSLLAKPLRSRYWTLSAWQDDQALAAFIREPPHVEAMRELRQVLAGFTTIRWTAAGGDLPPDWNEALARRAP